VMSDGEEALAAALASPPDLILTDVMMPKLDGVGLLRALRCDARTSTIPVVLLSARAGEDAVVTGLETGADDYLVKPFSARELLSRVATHLELARLRRLETDAAIELAETRAALLLDLDRKNKELEAFSYSVSHDLRSPLRTLDGFSQILLEDHAAQLDDEGKQHLGRIRSAAQRMGALIDALLELSYTGRRKLEREDVSLTGCARRIASNLARSDTGRSVEVVVAEGMHVDADPRLCEILLENLLGNAWKFTAKTPEARIEVGVVEEAGARVFFVRDNGAGFDPIDAGRLFTPFQRLHTMYEFPGTGIGLATVRRIVERHGGHVWAEGRPNGGATIRWTLEPRREPRSSLVPRSGAERPR
jgi:light-regulated signal transduction histidine kinase (bacteriophytochrome)